MSIRQRELQLELFALCAPRTAATVYVDGRPYWTAFTHAEAFKLMRSAQACGHQAYYKHGVRS